MTPAKIRTAKVDPRHGVAPVSVATSYGQPGGRPLTEKDIRKLMVGGSSFDALAALETISHSRLEEIAKDLVEKGSVPSDRFDFLR